MWIKTQSTGLDLTHEQNIFANANINLMNGRTVMCSQCYFQLHFSCHCVKVFKFGLNYSVLNQNT